MPAPAVGVKIEGLRETIRDLERLGVEVSDLKEVMSEISALGARGIAARAPRLSGALAGSARGNRAKGKATVTIGNARVLYAGVISYGWPARNIKADRYVQEEIADLAPRIPEMFEDGIDRVIRKTGLG